jgi:mannosyltransferase OCH1-like enzyme
MHPLLIFALLAVVVGVVVLITALVLIHQGDDISANVSTRQSETNQLLYSYGLFSSEPMSDKMTAMIQHNQSVTNWPHTVVNADLAMEDMKVMEPEVPGLIAAYPLIKRGVAKSDLARMVSLWVRGGHYVDLDVELQKLPPMPCPDGQVLLYTEHFSMNSKEHFVRIANYAVAASPRHPFLKHVVTEIVARVMAMQGKATWNDKDVLKTTGPDVITCVYHDWKRQPDTDMAAQVKRISYYESHSTVHHKCAGSWREHKDGATT